MLVDVPHLPNSVGPHRRGGCEASHLDGECDVDLDATPRSQFPQSSQVTTKDVIDFGSRRFVDNGPLMQVSGRSEFAYGQGGADTPPALADPAAAAQAGVAVREFCLQAGLKLLSQLGQLRCSWSHPVAPIVPLKMYSARSWPSQVSMIERGPVT